MSTDLQFMEKISWSDINRILDNNGNSIIIRYEDLIELIESSELVLTTKNGKRFIIDGHSFQYNLPENVALIDSGYNNYGENTYEVNLKK